MPAAPTSPTPTRPAARTSPTPTRPAARVWAPGRPVDVGATWGTLRRGGGDPTWRSAHATVWRGVRTPYGPVTLRVGVRAAAGHVSARAWGATEPREWVLEHLPTMLGGDDDPAGFVPRHPVLASALRARQGWRVPRTGLVIEALVPAVIEQKVTGQEAFGGYRRMVRRFGELAPGPGAELGLYVAPAPERLRAVPSWQWLQMGISPARADTVMRVVQVAGRLSAAADLPLPQARGSLQAVAGVGVWTAAEVAQRALGDPDAVSFGDYHVAKNVGWALTGREVDDDGLAELLEPYRGHRYRVQRLLELAGGMRPRRAPRMPPRRHLPVR